MRLLFTFAGGRGHAEPLIGIARAAHVAGHDVAFSGGERVLASLGLNELECFPSAPRGTAPPERIPLQRFSQQHEERVLRERFAGSLARARMPDIHDLCSRWQPDIVACDETDFGSMVVAERLGLPHATVLVIAAGSFIRPDVVAGALNELRADEGLADDPRLSMLSRHLVLSPFPPSYRNPADPLPPTAHSYRPDSGSTLADEACDLWSDWVGDSRLVYFTLGTVFNVEAGDLFSRVLAGVASLDVKVVATVGEEIDPAEFDPLPPHVRVEQFISQSSILPLCHAVVSHGGSGSVMGALAHGLPSVLLPMGADQPLNAARCAELGVAHVLDPVDATPDEIGEGLSHVLAASSYRAAALTIREEIAALPPIESAVTRLEQLRSEPRARGLGGGGDR